ncbi:FG-GAP repeat domain-containing protein [Streptomyces sp. bgisy154]|uniref:FG-GAP repeat domain-containing protein n=1 Tax=Streptomyces sp. bgisy154 TaxID=3413794 RepID=UPI003D72C9FA
MAKSSGTRVRQTLARVTAAALTAALAATGTSAFAADDSGPTFKPLKPSASASHKSTFTGSTAGTAAEDAQINALYGVDNNGDLYAYVPNGTGGLEAREYAGKGWQDTPILTQADHDNDGWADGLWHVTYGDLYSYRDVDLTHVKVGWGYDIYDKLFSAGDVGGAAADDLLARDKSGVLWLYLGYGDGRVTSRIKIGAGWNAYTQITGKGDLTNDGHDDIVARDKYGVLWLYQGTGSYKAPFKPRTKIGAGWNMFNYLISVGDIDLDGTTDLVARDTAGALWLYKGTGSAAAPYKPRVQIGTGGWNTYRVMF